MLFLHKTIELKTIKNRAFKPFIAYLLGFLLIGMTRLELVLITPKVAIFLTFYIISCEIV